MSVARYLAVPIAALASVAPSDAGLWDDIYHGLDLAATPIGSPVTTLSNGFRVNGARQGRVRILPNRLGDGYHLEFDRTFGPDDTGRPEVFDAGPYEVQLDGAIQSTLGFTRRNLAFHDSPPFYIGDGNLGIGNLNYEVRGKTGAQDVTLRGTLNGQGDIEVNQLGFYTLVLNVSNTNSELLLDGVLAEGATDTDYDIGPITVKGNVFVDAVAASLEALGVDSGKIEKIFPDSPIDRITQNITESLAEQANVIGEPDDAAKLSDVLAGRLLDSGVFGPFTSATAEQNQSAPNSVPEPASLALLVLGGTLLAGTWRRR